MDLIVLGGNSGLFHFLAPELKKCFDQIFIGSREQQVKLVEGAKNFNLQINNEKLKEVFKEFDKPVVVLNCLGYFGDIKDFFDYEPRELIKNIELNLSPFITIHQAARYLPTESLIINFSGAGVGGDKIELSNLGYASSKILLSNLIESLDRILLEYRIGTCAISPGPFPTNMQMEIIKHKDSISDVKLVQKTELLFKTKVDVRDLINLICFLSENKGIAKGRVWSAKWDKSFTNYLQNIEKHGFFRRIVQSNS